MTIRSRVTDERCRPLQRARDLSRSRLLPGRYGGTAALSRLTHSPARPYQGRQSRPRPGRARPAAAGGRIVGRLETRRGLGAGAPNQCDGCADHCARLAPPRAAIMNVIEILDIGLAVLV